MGSSAVLTWTTIASSGETQCESLATESAKIHMPCWLCKESTWHLPMIPFISMISIPSGLKNSTSLPWNSHSHFFGNQESQCLPKQDWLSIPPNTRLIFNPTKGAILTRQVIRSTNKKGHLPKLATIILFSLFLKQTKTKRQKEIRENCQQHER